MENKIEYKQYRRKQIAELADWTPYIDISGVSISEADIKNGSPKLGDKIARNPKNHSDRWLVAQQYFNDNFEPVDALYTERAGEKKFNNALEADALDWDTRNLEPVPPVEPDLLWSQIREEIAATLCGMIRGRRDVTPDNPVWTLLEDEYKRSYRHDADGFIAKVQPLLTALEERVRVDNLITSGLLKNREDLQAELTANEAKIKFFQADVHRLHCYSAEQKKRAEKAEAKLQQLKSEGKGK